MSFIPSPSQIRAGQEQVDRLNLQTFRLGTFSFGTICAFLAVVLYYIP